MAGRIESEALRLINFWRGASGLAPLAWDEKLYGGAKKHSYDMFRLGGLLHEPSLAVQGVAECIYGGRGNLHPKTCTAEGIVHSWLSSKAGHREILLGRFRKGAIGVYGERGKGFFATFRCRRGFWDEIFIWHNKKGVEVLRLPVKLMLLAGGTVSLILGLHGIWVRFSRLEVLFEGDAERLFLEIPVGPFAGQVEWMSMKGFQSAVIPLLFIVFGIVLMYLGWKVHVHHRYSVSRLLRRLRLW